MTDHPISLVSWNVAGRVKVLGEQIDFLCQREPDIVALQEIRTSTAARIELGLRRAGLENVKHSAYLAKHHNRPYGELIASKWPLELLPPTDFEIPFPERVLSVIIDSPSGSIELHTAHIPPGTSQGWKKIETFEGIYKRLACHSENHRILCGDFNSPQAEQANGRIVTWGERIKTNGEIVVKAGHERWDAGERCIIEGLARFDLPDVFRLINGYSVQEFTWYVKRKGKYISGRRFDHIFASRSLNPTQCRYLHWVREKELSDHSAIEARFKPKTSI
jgi:exonuclease III